jgi:alkanesulfonate monooxygenase SsuD/methylene tetrahydromethanopterin reductase-like flavin-dependent oxidoreductase (luciferase family)
VPWSVEQIRKGGDATVYAYVHVGVCERDDGIDAARRDLWSYAVVDSYARNFERAGFGSDVAAIRERQQAGDRDGAVAAVSDAFVDAIDIMGDVQQVRAAVQSYVDAGVEVPVIMPMPWGPDRRAVTERTIAAAISRPD